MARVTHVKKAQQRYKTVPVIDPETGQQKQVPMISKRTGEQKVTKKGRPVFLRLTQEDRTQPLPPLTCEACGKPIEVGTPYKHVTPKSGPYGGRQRNRHEGCPTWKPWDLSNAWWARIAQVTDGALDGFFPESPEEVQEKAQEIADNIRALAEESREAAQNIEDGFGHETSVSQEANDRAENLDTWADEIEQVEIPDLPDPEETDCDECEGTGDVEDEDAGEGATKACDECSGSGQVMPDDPTDDQMDEWRDEAIEALQGVLDNSPV